MPTINKNMYIMDVLRMDEGVVPIFMQNGLHCLGCALSSGETLEEACLVHGLDCDDLLEQLNEYFSLQDLPAAEV